MRPGITGLWQVKRTRLPGLDFQEWIKYDIEYVETQSWALDIKIIDILEHPATAEEAGILATPTLSDDSVAPPRRLIGDISNIAQVLEYFGYGKKDANP